MACPNINIYDENSAEKFLAAYKQRFPSLGRSKFNPSFNYIGGVLEFLSVNHYNYAPSITYSSSGAAHTPQWVCHFKFSYAGIEVNLDSEPFTAKADSTRNVYYKFLVTLGDIYEEREVLRQLSEVTIHKPLSPATSDKVVPTMVIVSPPLTGGEAKQPTLKSPTDFQPFSLQLVRAIRSYANCDPNTREYHILHSIVSLDDSSAAARMAQCFKEGSFNPYGNGQTDTPKYLNFFQPGFRTDSDGVWECFSSVMPSNSSPVAVFGRGDSQSEAFSAWYSNVIIKLNIWSPVDAKLAFLRALQSLPPPPDGHPLQDLWCDESAAHLFDRILEGSFNPYGNGQPAQPMMTKIQFFQRNKVAFAKLTPAQRRAKYDAYVRRYRARNTSSSSSKNDRPLSTIKQGDHSRIAPSKASAARAMASQIGQMQSRRIRTRNLNEIVSISSCAEAYFAALVCPFLWVDDTCDMSFKGLKIADPDKREDPCIPMVPNVKSRKFHCFARFTVQTTPLGTSPGSAWIAFAPRRLGNNNALDFQSPPILYTTSAYVSTNPIAWPNGMDTAAAVPAGVTGSNFNSDYNGADLTLDANGFGIRYRIVGAGIRIRYSGTEVNRGGTLHCFIHPNHVTVRNLSPPSCGNFETYFRMPITRDWAILTHTPVWQEDFNYYPDYISNPTFWAGQSMFSGLTQSHYMGFLITDCLNGTFEVEAIDLVEAVGSSVRGQTSTPVDNTGVALVLNTATPQALPEINKTKNLGSLIKGGIGALTTVFAPELRPLTNIAGDLISSAL